MFSTWFAIKLIKMWFVHFSIQTYNFLMIFMFPQVCKNSLHKILFSLNSIKFLNWCSNKMAKTKSLHKTTCWSRGKKLNENFFFDWASGKKDEEKIINERNVSWIIYFRCCFGLGGMSTWDRPEVQGNFLFSKSKHFFWS